MVIFLSGSVENASSFLNWLRNNSSGPGEGDEEFDSDSSFSDVGGDDAADGGWFGEDMSEGDADGGDAGDAGGSWFTETKEAGEADEESTGSSSIEDADDGEVRDCFYSPPPLFFLFSCFLLQSVLLMAAMPAFLVRVLLTLQGWWG